MDMAEPWLVCCVCACLRRCGNSTLNSQPSVNKEAVRQGLTPRARKRGGSQAHEERGRTSSE